jgi:hypothetical protein
MADYKLFEPFTIKNVRFANRVLRSSLGGRMAYYDGRVSPSWVNFESRFARGGVGGIISATIGINKARMSPLEYPSIHDDFFVGPLREGVAAIKKAGGGKCPYIIQIGDPGGHTHTSVFPQPSDAISASSTFDLLYGYCKSTYLSKSSGRLRVVWWPRAATASKSRLPRAISSISSSIPPPTDAGTATAAQPTTAFIFWAGSSKLSARTSAPTSCSGFDCRQRISTICLST